MQQSLYDQDLYGWATQTARLVALLAHLLKLLDLDYYPDAGIAG